MKRLALSFLFLAGISTTILSQDLDGCKDHPMFPNRMANYLISECASNYDAADFNLAAGGEKMINKEGTKTTIAYQFNAESGQQKPSCLQILRNYENAAKKIGGITVFLNVGEFIGIFKIMKSGKERAWVKVETGGNDNNDFYTLTVVELEEMQQEITSTDMMTALNNEGRIALYINFETGKSDIQSGSQKIVDQIAEMMKSNPTLKISVEGHTDNVGTASGNKILSENRARAVMNNLTAQGIDGSRILSKGWGQDKPISDNTTEDGKSKNRRVEVVKL